MEWIFLFLLLPVAAFSGWLIGLKRTGVKEQGSCEDLNADYFKGLNYLLNEQSDKALEVFVRILEADSETVETHFALGNLFLRRGEVDRAIRIHQNLIARPTLTQLQRKQALFELGKDYLRAGLLDRAESLFIQSSENPDIAPLALKYLLEVYQKEKEWSKAIEVATKLRDKKNLAEMSTMIAQFLCESAEAELSNGRESDALRMVKNALEEDSNCVRATLLKARIEMGRRDYKKAIMTLQRVEHQDVALLPEIIRPLIECHQHLGSVDELLSYLDGLIRQNKGASTILVHRAELIRIRIGISEAIAVLIDYLKNHPSLRVMNKLLEWKLQSGAIDNMSDLAILNIFISAHLEGKPTYQCRNCGFTARTLHWHCPTCKGWNTVKPIQGIESE